jgi:hypothetical protein
MKRRDAPRRCGCSPSTFFAGERDMIELLTAKTDLRQSARSRQHYGIDGAFKVKASSRPTSAIVPRQGILTQGRPDLGALARRPHLGRSSAASGCWRTVLCHDPAAAARPASTSRRSRSAAGQDPARDLRGCTAPIRSAPSCHVAMDPLGFGLEHYDALGAYRLFENGG